MTHRAQTLIEAVGAALPGSIVMPSERPAESSTMLVQVGLTPEGDPAPDNLARLVWQMELAVDVYTYERVNLPWYSDMYARQAAAHAAIMDEPGTYGALPWFRGAFVQDVSEVEMSTENDVIVAYSRALYRLDFTTSVTDLES